MMNTGSTVRLSLFNVNRTGVIAGRWTLGESPTEVTHVDIHVNPTIGHPGVYLRKFPIRDTRPA